MEDNSLGVVPLQEDTISAFDDVSLSRNSEMEIRKVCRAYNDTKTS